MSNSRSSGQYFGIKAGEGSLSELYIGNKGGTQATFVTASSVDGKADVHNINNLSASSLTASHVRINTLDVVTINSIQQTQEELNISASLIVASDGAAASDEADGSGLFISGANASFTWNNTKSAMVVNKAFSGSSTIEGAGITGTSLALQSGGITAAGSIAGVSTLTATGLIKTSAGNLEVQNDGTIGTDSNSDMLTLGDTAETVTVKDGFNLDIAGHNGSKGLKLSGSLVTATAAELNILDGVTATTAELNLLDGVTATTAELNYVDVAATGTVEASKAVVVDASKDATGFRSVTGSGDVAFANLHASSNIYAAGDGSFAGSLTASALQMNSDGSSIGYNGGNVELDVAGGTVMTLTSTSLQVGVAITGSSGAHFAGASTFGSSVAATGSITAGTSFIIGSADLNEADMEKLDGITNGTVAANKAVVVNGSKDANGFRSVTGSGDAAFANLHASSNVYAGGSLVIGSTDLNETDLAKIDGITNGTGAANKALVLNASADVAGGLRSVTGSGDVAFANLHASSNIYAAGTLGVDGSATFGGAVTFGDHATLNNGKHLKAQSNDQCDLGENGTAFRAGYITTLNSTTVNATNVITGDFHMKNERGDWTLFEESDHIRIRNNATGQVFRMGMTLIEE